MALTEKTAPNALGGIASAAQVLLPLIFGSGKTTTTNTASPDAINALKNTIATANSNASNNSITDGIVNNIMRQAAIQFAPVLGASKNAGIYNSSTVKQLADESQAEATGQASQAVLNYRTGQQQIAGNAAGELARATGTQTSRTASAIPSGVQAALGTAMAAKSLFANRKAIGDFVNDPVGSIKKFLDIGGDDASSGATDLSGGGVSFGGGSTGQDFVGNGSGIFSNPPAANAAQFPTANTVGTSLDTFSNDAATLAGGSSPDASGVPSGDTAVDAASAMGGTDENIIGNAVQIGTPSSVAPDTAIASGNVGSSVATEPGQADIALSTDSGTGSADSAALDSELQGGTQVADAGNVATDAIVDNSAFEVPSEVANVAADSVANSAATEATSAATGGAFDMFADEAPDVASATGGAFDMFADEAPSAFGDAATDTLGDIGSSFLGDAGAALSAVGDFLGPIGWANTALSFIAPDNPVSSAINSVVGDVVGGVTDFVNGAGDVIGDIGSGIGDAVSDVGDAVGSASIVCTEAVRQKLLSSTLVEYETFINYELREISPYTVLGYHAIAIPIVKKMRVSQKWAKGGAKWANAYCHEIIFNNGGFLGKFIRYVGEPLCWTIGCILVLLNRAPDFKKELYANG